MCKCFSLILVLLLFYPFQKINAQDDLFPGYKIAIQGTTLVVKDQSDNLVYQKQFHSPVGKFVDFDNDSLNEYFVVDTKSDGSYIYYTGYIFCQKDSFYLADSIYSGITEPSVTVSEENNTTVLIAGQSELDSLNILYSSNVFYTSFNCFRFSDCKLYNANDEFYDIFVDDNDFLISYIEKEYNISSKNCAKTNSLKPAIAVLYLNLLKASEISMAKQVINSCYFCDDKEDFIKYLKDLQ
jgi:hypothetical protein